ncbi:MAG TPA: ParB/RepB/Spo0J family partition protein [Candidatus Onthovicinus excrementipullorum]|nr:ParB/RepB/Spo0J family partition protein [Candidatus Onthovicinus excrementipullorum]
MVHEKKSLPPAAGSILMIPRDEIYPNPDQPRRRFSMDELEGLAQSIHENGMLQPVSVRTREAGGYELIAGERRLRAAKMIGMSSIPCIVIRARSEQSAVFALIENLQREDLNFFEEARAIESLMDHYGLTQEEMALRLGKAQSTLSNKLRLLRLSPRMCAQIERAGLTERHARALLKLDQEKERQEVLDQVIRDDLNVSQTEKLIASRLAPKAHKNKNVRFLFRDVRIFLNTIGHAIDTMRRSGIEADSEKTEDENFITYTVRIPKAVAYRMPASGREPSLRTGSR